MPPTERNDGECGGGSGAVAHRHDDEDEAVWASEVDWAESQTQCSSTLQPSDVADRAIRLMLSLL